MSKENKLTREDIETIQHIVTRTIIEVVPTVVTPIIESVVEKELDKFAGVVKRGFDEVHEKFDLINENIAVINDNLDRIDQKIDKNHAEFIRLYGSHDIRIIRLEQTVA